MATLRVCTSIICFDFSIRLHSSAYTAHAQRQNKREVYIFIYSSQNANTKTAIAASSSHAHKCNGPLEYFVNTKIKYIRFRSDAAAKPRTNTQRPSKYFFIYFSVMENQTNRVQHKHNAHYKI